MKRFLFFLLVCLSANIYAQTFNEILRNDNSVIKASLGNRQCLYKINDVDEDTLWMNFIDDMSLDTPQGRIISLDKNLNICSEIIIPPYFNRGPIITDKINDKFYSIDYKNIDTVLFVSFDRNGNKLIEKPIWTNNNIDTFWIGRKIKLLTLSNKNFLLVSEVQFPSTKSSQARQLDAVKFILIDTMANIINTKIYSQKSEWFQMSMCEMGNHIILDKTGLPVDTGSFSTFGTSFIDKQTLEVVDSIPRKWIIDTMAGGDITKCMGNFELESLNDSLYVGIYEKWGHPAIRVFNKNTRQEISKIFYTLDGGDDNIPPAAGSYWSGVYESSTGLKGTRFAYQHTDSIYTAYLVRLDQTWTCGWIELMNFGIDGNINFVYRFSILDSTHTPFITGMKTFDDGSLVITAMNSIPGIRETWLIKFNPNGLVGLSNVETGERASLRVYPNPAKNFVLVDIEADRFDKADIEIYDLGGRMVKKSKLSAKVGNRIDVSGLKAGVYGYRVELNGKGVSGKIVIGE